MERIKKKVNSVLTPHPPPLFSSLFQGSTVMAAWLRLPVLKGPPAICERYGANCSGPHHRYLFEKEVVTLKTFEKLTFVEARDRGLFRYVRPGTTLHLF